MVRLTELSRRELIIIVEDTAAPSWGALPGVAPAREALAAAAPEVDRLAQEITLNGGVLRPVFHRPSTPQQLSLNGDALPGFGVEETTPIPPKLSTFFRVEADDDRLEWLSEMVRQNPIVVAAYIQPPTELPLLNDMLPSPATPPLFSSDFTERQGYRNESPDGVNVPYAWLYGGGRGNNVQIIDIEWSWNLTHEDLTHHEAPIYGGAPRDSSVRGRNHGTAVLGVTSASDNGFGITGICPDATIKTITNTGGILTAEAIQLAADMLNPGDILILEMHRPGPRFNFADRPDQRGYIAVEWWPCDLDAIKYAVSRGIVVVEAAGNGGEDLDDGLYNIRPGDFPATWNNPFRRPPNDDSGAILVGAGAPPPGTHGRTYGPARSRLNFSNYGALIDAQGWGHEVTTCGYGDLQGGTVENLWYTDDFSGTSSATPIVAGALACVQGVRKANGLAALTPAQMRHLLRSTGSPQEDGPTNSTGVIIRPSTQRIGNLPNLQQLIDEALLFA